MNIVDFTKTDESQKWRIINDGVMGGNSKGFIHTKNNYGIFNGDISLENNGGFSSTVRPIQPINQQLTTFVIDVETHNSETDNTDTPRTNIYNTNTHDTQQIYQLRAIMNVDGYRLAYKHDFVLTSTQRRQIHLPLNAFEASFRGRIINKAPMLKSQEIIEIGLLIKSKMAGKFALRIYSIKLI